MVTRRAAAGFEHPQAIVVPARRVRHRQAARDHLVGGHVDEDAAVALVLAPALRLVGLAQRGQVARLAALHRQAVEVAAVLRRVVRDEARPPARHEAGFRIQRAQAGEQRVHEPQVAVLVPGHLVDVDRAGDVAAPRQVHRVVARRVLQALGHRRHVAEFGDLDRRAQRQPLAIGGHAHRPVEGAEVRVDRGAVGPQDHQLAGLVGAHEQTAAELAQQVREVGRVHAAEHFGDAGRLRFLVRGRLGAGGTADSSAGVFTGASAKGSAHSAEAPRGSPPDAVRCRAGREIVRGGAMPIRRCPVPDSAAAGGRGVRAGYASSRLRSTASSTWWPSCDVSQPTSSKPSPAATRSNHVRDR